MKLKLTTKVRALCWSGPLYPPQFIYTFLACLARDKHLCFQRVHFFAFPTLALSQQLGAGSAVQAHVPVRDKSDVPTKPFLKKTQTGPMPHMYTHPHMCSSHTNINAWLIKQNQ